MIKLYTIGCPKCNVLEKKLKAKGIEFKAISDRDYLETLKLSGFPILELEDNTRMDFHEANDWINKQ